MMDTFKPKLHGTMFVISIADTSFFQPLLLTGLSSGSESPLSGKLRSSSKTDLIYTFALGQPICSQNSQTFVQ